ncbi:MAG TPA: type III-A CRISPR-associated RAMP protein Csm3 [bacterium]|nr:type III-A CRISPR-associated RAMP protein Csm3 [bacterium]HOM27668.1 type III-A CRISPR-associated RAMP protein Csm3 [bacterium]
MLNENKIKVNLLGKILIKGDIKVITGLRIAGATTGLKIGGVDQPVITDAFGRPYIPGSSLKGKLRMLAEKNEKVKLNKTRNVKNSKKEEPYWHECDAPEEYLKCKICKVWGILSSDKLLGIPVGTRLIVRDIFLDEKSITEEMRRNMELEWTEIKMETAIDRLKGTALEKSLRTIDRVPAGAVFRPMEMVFNIFEESDKNLLKVVFESMELLEDDYLGGMGSRGYGKIKFENIEIYWNKKEDYESGNINVYKINDGYATPKDIVKNFSNIQNNIT